MSAFLKLPDFSLTLLADGTSSSLSAVQGNRPMIIDFWTTKCTRCPAALDKLNTEAGKAKKAGKDIVYLSCALSQGEGNQEVAADLINDSDLENLTHVFVSVEVKEEAKSIFGFSAVPFIIVVDKDGNVLGSGDPKSVDYNALLAASAAAAVSTTTVAAAEVKTAAAVVAETSSGSSSQKDYNSENTNQLPSYEISLLEDDTKTTLTALQNGRPMIMDFWTTACCRCPAALDKLNKEAAKAKKAGENTLYVACALSQGEGDQEFAAQLSTEGSWDNMEQIFMSVEVKEKAKKFFGFTAVPFIVVADKNGKILGKGFPSSLDPAALIAASESESESAPAAAAAAIVVVAASNNNKENSENNANTRNSTPAPTATAATTVATEPVKTVAAAEPAAPAPAARPVFTLDEDF